MAWSKKGAPGVVTVSKTRATTTTVLGAISAEGLIKCSLKLPQPLSNKKRKRGDGVGQMSKGTVTGHYISFLKAIMDEMDRYPHMKGHSLVMDNAPIHTSDNIVKYVSSIFDTKNDKDKKLVASLEVTLFTLNSIASSVVTDHIINGDSNSSSNSDDLVKYVESESEDEFMAYYNNHDEELFSSNKYDLMSEHVSYSPITPITLNNINTYGIIDTGANISIMNKTFALKHDIKFQEIPGSLILANGNRVSRMQSIEFVQVEYDNIDTVIQHKFDIIEDNVMSYEGKVLLGIDLLPKLSIHLMNVAVKHKGSKKESEDLVNDYAYQPNVSRAGTNQEQNAFDAAVKKYIEANQSLDKCSL